VIRVPSVIFPVKIKIKKKNNRSDNDKNSEGFIKGKWEEFKKGKNEKDAWKCMVDWECQNTPKIELTEQFEAWLTMTGLGPELWDRGCDRVSDNWKNKHRTDSDDGNGNGKGKDKGQGKDKDILSQHKNSMQHQHTGQRQHTSQHQHTGQHQRTGQHQHGSRGQHRTTKPDPTKKSNH